jgi:hypothetical protein
MAPALVFILFLVALYFAPVIVAAVRAIHNGGGVIVVNVLFGWTLIGWVIALVMALTGETQADWEERRAAQKAMRAAR